MTTLEAKKRIESYAYLFLSIMGKAIKENMNALECGRTALKLVGCPSDLALEIERLAMIQLNKN